MKPYFPVTPIWGKVVLFGLDTLIVRDKTKVKVVKKATYVLLIIEDVAYLPIANTAEYVLGELAKEANV